LNVSGRWLVVLDHDFVPAGTSRRYELCVAPSWPDGPTVVHSARVVVGVLCAPAPATSLDPEGP
jgi:hypothetical protein